MDKCKNCGEGICKGCGEAMKDIHPALSRYGHGDICSACGLVEAFKGDFIKDEIL